VVITDELREACAWVANRATHVRIVETAVGSYALGLGDPMAHTERRRVLPVRSPAQREYEAAFWLTLDAINFGSGWFPTLRKRRWPTGYRTIEGGLRSRFQTSGPWSATELIGLPPEELAAWLDQDPEHELIGLFVQSLRDLGTRVAHAGSFSAVVDAGDGSAIKLVGTLAQWGCYRDVSVYDGRAVPFLKRAQIAAADLDRAGVAAFTDLGQLTMFADNLVPHVLRQDGVLSFAPALVSRIEHGQLIPHGSPEEIEIRACAVHAVELIVAAARRGLIQTTAAQIDELLWNRGQGTRYKAVPRHRSRCTAY
jgi:hypothetical protein